MLLRVFGGLRRSTRPFTTNTTNEAMDVKEYHRIADTALDYLCEEFERMGDVIANEHYDVEYSMGVLKLALGPKYGTLVLNKQPPNRQIWLSSPISYTRSSFNFIGDRRGLTGRGSGGIISGRTFPWRAC